MDHNDLVKRLAWSGLLAGTGALASIVTARVAAVSSSWEVAATSSSQKTDCSLPASARSTTRGSGAWRS